MPPISRSPSFSRKPESSAERAAKNTDVQRALKESAAESRAKAAERPAKAPKRTLKRG